MRARVVGTEMAEGSLVWTEKPKNNEITTTNKMSKWSLLLTEIIINDKLIIVNVSSAFYLPQIVFM